MVNEWKQYRRRTIDQPPSWNSHIAPIPGTRKVESEYRDQILQIINKIEARMADLVDLMEANRRVQEEIVATQNGVCPI